MKNVAIFFILLTGTIWTAPSGFAQEKIFWGHRGAVNAVAVSANGRFLVSASSDKSVAVWDTASRQPVIRFTKHNGSVLSMALSPDAETVASGDADGQIYVWQRSTGKVLASLHGHTNAVVGLAFSPDGKYLVSGGWDRLTQVWDWATNHSVSKLSSHRRFVLAVAFSPDGQHVVSGSADSTAIVWHWSSNRAVATLRGHRRAIRAVWFDPTGQFVVTGSADSTLRIYDWNAGRTEQILHGHTGIVRAVSGSADGETLVSGSDDGTVRTWEAATGQLLRTLTGPNAAVTSVAFGPSGEVIGGGVDQSLRLWLNRPISTTSGPVTRLIWTQPNPLLYQNRTYTSPEPSLYVQATVLATVSATTLRQSLRFYINGEALPAGNKMGETRLVQHEQEFMVERTIPLREGNNTLEWAVQFPGQLEVRSRPLVVAYTPAFKPNLYVYAVGVESNLKYTQQDAETVARLFKSQQGRLFEHVSAEIYGRGQTKAGDLREMLEPLGNRADVIRPQDVLLLFVSGHGTVKNGDFRILGSTYSEEAWRSSSVSYRDDIIASLSNLNCKKVILIDACHSGGIMLASGAKANVELADVQTALAQTPPGTAVLSSSGSNELSYENDAWQNGAFTEALSEALEAGRADSNKDGVVTINELYQYLQNRVPDLVKTVMQKEQHPQFKPGDNGDFPLFFIGSNGTPAPESDLKRSSTVTQPNTRKPPTGKRY